MTCLEIENLRFNEGSLIQKGIKKEMTYRISNNNNSIHVQAIFNLNNNIYTIAMSVSDCSQ